MHRILSAAHEALTAGIILIPLLMVMDHISFHNIRKTAAYIIFSLYIAAVYAIVGLPDIIYLRFDPSFSFVPVIGMLSDIKNSILNIILFIPLGILLPLMNERYVKLKNTALFGLCMTFAIEILQIFTFRLTDINDIITNFAGTVIGYHISVYLTDRFPRLALKGEKSHEVFMVCGLTFAVMFFIQPFIWDFFWSLVP